MKKKVGIITFHAAHNYGSNLQAYALQKTIENLGIDCELINFRTERQKDQYRPLTKRKGVKYIVKNGYFLLNYVSRKKKYDIFEQFIDKQLKKSNIEYNTLEALYSASMPYTHYISGSDQIWNTVPNDANMAYFLPFVQNGKKIAYAPSFGQSKTQRNIAEIAEYIKEYDMLSVREKEGASFIKEITGINNIPVLVDPTLLIDSTEWEALAEKQRMKEDYIFFYTLFADKSMIHMVKMISKQLDLPVVISTVSNQYDIFSGFVKKTDTGPREFLSLIKHAKFVCTSSFHGTVFSVLLKKPFYAINGMDDSRIATLLQKVKLEHRSISIDDITGKLPDIDEVDFSQAEQQIHNERQESLDYIKKALEI